MPRDTRIDTYIASREEFAQPILAWLRERVHAACPEVEETIKWSMPAFSYKGKPLASMAAFKAHAGFGFWDRQALATGKEGEAMGQYGRIRSLADLPPARVGRGAGPCGDGADRCRAASRHARRRRPSPRPKCRPSSPRRSRAMRSAAATFNGFPPRCRREYCEWIAEAKRPETKAKRVAEAVGWMREGKRRNWKYESC